MAKYLYNGVELPALPSWDKEAYPYAYIIGEDTRYLSLSSVVKTANTTGFITVSANSKVYILEDGAWVNYSGSSISWRTPIWCSYDIYDENGNLVLAASTPISLEGMKVIEWDGDLSGLAMVGTGGIWDLYRIGDSLTDISSLGAVILDQYSDSIVVSDAELNIDGEYGAVYVTSDILSQAIGQPLVINVPVDTPGVHEGLYFVSVTQEVLDAGGSGHISLFAYTPTPKTILTLDHTALTQGWIVGKRLAAMRGKRKPVAYLYNGVRLPKLPEYDKSKYPYAMLTYEHERGYYDVKVSETPFEYYTTTLLVKQAYVSGTGGVVYRLLDGVWSVLSGASAESTNISNGSTVYHDVIWANHDINDKDDGSLYLSASDPVPVYE